MGALSAAHAYRERGWVTFPLNPGSKLPAAQWKIFQTTRPAAALLDHWWRFTPDAGVAVVTGAISGLVVADLDTAKHPSVWPAFLERTGGVPDTPRVCTGSGGFHLYYRHPGGRVRNRVALLPGLDVRADGGYVAAPPTLHASGRRYQWEREGELAPAPAWLLEAAPEPAGAPLPFVQAGTAANAVPEGQRNATLFRAGVALRHEGLSENEICGELWARNQARCRPPLSSQEVRSIAATVARY